MLVVGFIGFAIVTGVQQEHQEVLTSTLTNTPAPTDTPVPPTPTPNLNTDSGVVAYAKNILSGLSPHGSITQVDNNGGLHVVDYISSKMFLSNSAARDDVQQDCFFIEQALWTSRLNLVEPAIYVDVQSDLVDKYGNSSRGDIGKVALSRDTEKKFNWANLDYQTAWNNKIFDQQWLLPDIANS